MKWYGNLKIRTKILISTLLIALAGCAAGISGLAGIIYLKQHGGSELAGIADGTMIAIIVMVGLCVLFCVAGTLVLTRVISRPLHMLARGAEKMAAGDTNIQEVDTEAKDEVGVLIRAFSATLRSIKAVLADVDMLVEATLDGRLSVRADAEAHQGDYRKVIEGINAMLDSLTRPVAKALSVIGKLGKGQLDVSIYDDDDFKGDFEALKSGVNDTIATLKGYISEISRVLAEVEQGNLDVGIAEQYRGDFMALKDSINSIITSFNSVLGEFSMAADQVAAGSRQVSSGNQEISQGATEQASAIEELSASITQLAAQIKQNAADANSAMQLAQSAKSAADLGNEKMAAMLDSMRDINDSSSNISKIIRVIDDIAFQTNILALNAAVEAARAGVHGKGFAVVAEEVRNLASRSATAARETTVLIENSIKNVQAGTVIADETAQALRNIVESSEKTLELLGGIAQASDQQATGIAQINRGIDQLSQVVQINSATAQEGAAASEQLSSQAELLKGMVERFQLATALPQGEEPAALSAPEQGTSEQIDFDSSDFGKY